MVLEPCPSSDLHLALNAPFTRVVLSAVRHEPQGSAPVPAADLAFAIDPLPQPSQHDNGDIRIDPASGEITALQESTSWLWVSHKEQIGTSYVTRQAAVRVIVHEELQEVWLGNHRASVNAGSDNLVLSVFARNSLDQVVDVTGHGFVTFRLTRRDFGEGPHRQADCVDAVAGAHTAATQDLSLDHPGRYQEGDLLYVPRTNEHIRVTSANGSSPIGVERGVGSPAAPLQDGEEIWLLGGIGPTAGRVRASLASAGSQLKVSMYRGSTILDGLHVVVKPSLVQTPDEPEAITALREVIEPLPFRAGPSPPRRNILLLAEGFTASQEAPFKRFARRVARRLTRRRAHEPFRLLREDYRLWLGFLPSASPGIAVNTRVVHATGEPGSITRIDDALLQVPDCACGMAYGRRAGETIFEPEASGKPSAQDTWTQYSREPAQLLKDWRRIGSRRGVWQAEALQLFGGLRKKGTSPDDPEYRIGETWGPGGADQGLVLLVTNDQVSAGTYTAGDARTPNGFLFGALTLRNLDRFTIETTGARTSHGPEFDTTEQKRMPLVRVLSAIHELAHGFFLGDEYEDVHQLGSPPQETSFVHDNLDTDMWIDQEGVTKFSRMPRVVKSSPLALSATVQTTGEVTVVLAIGEGGRWTGHTGPVSLQTRNINDSSWAGVTDEYNNVQVVYTRYPAFRAHPYTQAMGLTITAANGNQLTLRGTSLVPGDVFPPGSMLFEPRLHPAGTGVPLGLVLPGVLTYMGGRSRPLAAKTRPGGCQQPDETATVFPTAAPADLGIRKSAAPFRTIGLYEGAGQSNCSVYRPTGECAMRNVVKSDSTVVSSWTRRIRFCHVCRYVIVNEINPARHPDLDLLYPGEPLP